MDSLITYAELIEAVDLANGGINLGQTIAMETWDRILPTLIQAHSLCGGTTRNLIRRMFDGTYCDLLTVSIALDELHRNLATRPAQSHTRGKRRSPGSCETTGQQKLI